MAILEAGLAGLVGTFAGLIEKPIAKWMDLKVTKENNRHVEELQGLQHSHELLMADKELLGEGIKADTEIFTGSYKHDMPAGETSKWVNNIRALVRPATVVLTFVGSIYDAETFLPTFLLALSWYFASRVRTQYPE